MLLWQSFFLSQCNSSEEAEEVGKRHQKRLETMEKWLDSEENQLAQSIEKEIGNRLAKELQDGHKEILDKVSRKSEGVQKRRERGRRKRSSRREGLSIGQGTSRGT